MKLLIALCLFVTSFAVMADQVMVRETKAKMKVQKVSCTLLSRKLKIKATGVPNDVARLAAAGLKTDRIKKCGATRDAIREQILNSRNEIQANLKITTRIFKRTDYRGGYRYGMYIDCITYKDTKLEATSDAVRRGGVILTAKRSMREIIDRHYGACRD